MVRDGWRASIFRLSNTFRLVFWILEPLKCMLLLSTFSLSCYSPGWRFLLPCCWEEKHSRYLSVTLAAARRRYHRFCHHHFEEGCNFDSKPFSMYQNARASVPQKLFQGLVAFPISLYFPREKLTALSSKMKFYFHLSFNFVFFSFCFSMHLGSVCRRCSCDVLRLGGCVCTTCVACVVIFNVIVTMKKRQPLSLVFFHVKSP